MKISEIDPPLTYTIYIPFTFHPPKKQTFNRFNNPDPPKGYPRRCFTFYYNGCYFPTLVPPMLGKNGNHAAYVYSEVKPLITKCAEHHAIPTVQTQQTDVFSNQPHSSM